VAVCIILYDIREINRPGGGWRREVEDRLARRRRKQGEKRVVSIH